jgi:hypothetical protein
MATASPTERSGDLGAAVVGILCLVAGLCVGLGLAWATPRHLRPGAPGGPGGPAIATDVIVIMRKDSAPDEQAELIERVKADPDVQAACQFSPEDQDHLNRSSPASDEGRPAALEDVPPTIRIHAGGDANAVTRIVRSYWRLRAVHLVAGQLKEQQWQLDGWECTHRGTMLVG